MRSFVARSGSGSILVFLLFAGCGDPESAPAPEPETVTLTTEEYQVPAGAEQYLCYAKTLEEDLVIDQFTYEAPPSAHHMLLARTLIPEPEGMSECDVLIKTSWIPLFGSGNGDAKLEVPQGAGYVIPKGTQLLVQLHLLNATKQAAKEIASVGLRKSNLTAPSPISIYAFGTNAVSLPPGQKASVGNDCTTSTDTGIDIFAWWPHMHQLGTSLTLEIGKNENDLHEVYRIDPWDFDDQSVESAPLHIESGTFTRVTCNYDNPSEKTVTFGESSNDEMCYLVAFVTGNDGQLDGCITTDSPPMMVPNDPAAGKCGEQTPNELGVGAACTKDGGECMSGLTCSMDQGGNAPGFCLKVGGCEVNDDCGGNFASCCAPVEAGGIINICIPEACRPTDCIPQK